VPAIDPLVIAHLTDPHIPLGMPPLRRAAGKRGLSWLNWLRQRRRLHRPEIATRLVADLQAHRPDLIVMTGDLLNFSLPEEFARGAEWLAALGAPERVGVVPGNHEALIRGFEAHMTRHWGPFVAGDDGRPVFPWMRRRGAVAVIGVSSAVATAPAIAAGRVGAEQCAALARLLAEARRAGLCRVVLIHHPPTDIVRWHEALRDRAHLRAVLMQEGVELVLHGHSHRADLSWIDTAAGRVPVIGAPSFSTPAGAVPDAGAWRRLEIARAGNGWHLDLRERRIVADGEVADGPHLHLRLPDVDIARAGAGK
jgi:3',5'-cyclic AMP phosphodiesterase CpdA